MLLHASAIGDHLVNSVPLHASAIGDYLVNSMLLHASAIGDNLSLTPRFSVGIKPVHNAYLFPRPRRAGGAAWAREKSYPQRSNSAPPASSIIGMESNKRLVFF